MKRKDIWGIEFILLLRGLKGLTIEVLRGLLGCERRSRLLGFCYGLRPGSNSVCAFFLVVVGGDGDAVGACCFAFHKESALSHMSEMCVEEGKAIMKCAPNFFPKPIQFLSRWPYF
jgi:hypothetical protein